MTNKKLALLLLAVALVVGLVVGGVAFYNHSQQAGNRVEMLRG